MEISGKNIIIRKYRDEDAPQFFAAAIESIDHMIEFMPWCHAEYSIGDSRLWVKSRNELWESGQEYSFIICSKETGSFLGGIDINQINFDHKIGNIGYWVRKSALKQGVATEAVSLISMFGFESLKLNRLEIVTLPNNLASIKLAEKCGANFDGVLRKRLVVHGEAKDACMYSMVSRA